MDGPSSYRDRQSGQIHSLPQNHPRVLRKNSVGNNNNNTPRGTEPPPSSLGPLIPPGASISSRLIPPMTIGERMAAASSVSSCSTAGKGTLNDVLLGSKSHHPPPPQQQQQLLHPPHRPESIATAPTLPLQDTVDDDDDANMLSTSLTGIEVLRQHRSDLLTMHKFASDPNHAAVLPPPSSIITSLGNPPSRLPSHEALRSLCPSPLPQQHPFDMDDME